MTEQRPAAELLADANNGEEMIVRDSDGARWVRQYVAESVIESLSAANLRLEQRVEELEYENKVLRNGQMLREAHMKTSR